MKWRFGTSPVLSWAWGLDRELSRDSGGRLSTAPRADVRAVSLLREADLQSLDLLRVLLTAEPAEDVELSNGVETLILRNVFISGYSPRVDAGADTPVMDWVQLDFESFEYSRAGGRACGNIPQNNPC